MMLLFVEYIPWIAFIGAGLLVGWVGADIARSRLRKPRNAAPETQDSGRGLAGPPERLKPEPEVAEAAKAVEVAPEQLEIEPAEELVLPVTQAVSLTEAADETEAEPEKPAETEAEQEPAELEPTEEEVSGEMMLVRRDPSVRVFDAVVAPSERKVLTNED